MKELLIPRDSTDLAEIIAQAYARPLPLEIIGEGSKQQMGRPMKTAAMLSTRHFSGIIRYSPNERMIIVRSGTSMSMVEHTLRHENQQLAFEPVDYGPLFGHQNGQGSIGAVIACNLSGSRRIEDGAARDWLLGVQAVTGRGQIINASAAAGRGNAGFSLSRGLAGSWGTLCVFTELTIRVMPRPESTATLALFGLDDRLAIQALCDAMASPWRVTGAIHLQKKPASRLSSPSLANQGEAVTAIRLEGFPQSVAVGAAGLRSLLNCYGRVADLDEKQSASIWRDMQHLQFISRSQRPVWRISTAPRNGPLLVSGLERIFELDASYDWAGGLVWLEVPDSSDVSASDIRRILAHLGGHATLIRANREVRSRIEVFHPSPGAAAKLKRNLKHAFDPGHILNPGRIHEENRQSGDSA